MWVTDAMERPDLEKLIPAGPERRKSLVTLFVESMDYAHAVRPEWCAVKRWRRKIRLHAGGFIVLTIEGSRVWLTTDPNRSVPEGLGCWEWDLGESSEYTRVPSHNGFFTPEGQWRQQWQQIAPSHFDYIYRVCTSGPAPDHRTPASHDEQPLRLPASRDDRPSAEELHLREQRFDDLISKAI